jgi:DNA-binding transcriptional regulator YiaG
MTPSQIRSLRKKRRETGEQFAAVIGLKGKHRRKTVWAWETGERKPGPQSILLMKQLRKGQT